jgi:uncharacterized protein (DUF58 family)
MGPALDPAVVAAIDDLQLVARRVVEGARSGAHRSPFHGFSADFSQHRAYRPGDDLKYLDWKLLARTDRLYTRQFRETTNLKALVSIDTSGSMAFPEATLSKFRYPVVLAAALAYLIVSQGDSVGLLTSSGDVLAYVPSKAGRPHLRTVLARLARLEPGGTWQAQRVVTRAADVLGRRGVLFVLSDFYDEEAGALRELARAARRGHDVSAMQILSREELTFPYKGPMTFADLESGVERVADARAIARRYRDEVSRFVERVRSETIATGVDYTLVTTDIAPEQSLRKYLIRRGSPQVSHAEREKA